MNRAFVATLTAVALLPAACSSATSAGSPARPEGAVTGHYQTAGGPAPGAPRPQPGSVWAYAGYLTLTKLMSAQAVAHVGTDKSGGFTFHLKAGSYTLLGVPGSSGTPRSHGCGAPTYARVIASTTITAELVCSVP